LLRGFLSGFIGGVQAFGNALPALGQHIFDWFIQKYSEQNNQDGEIYNVSNNP
jgi:hypothetical protein